MSELLTASRLASYRQCARLHQLKYDQRIELVREDRGPRSWGSAFHRALEAYGLGRMRGDVEGGLRDAFAVIDAAAELDAYERERAIATMAGYHARWSGDGLATLAIEAQFEAPLINPDSLAASRSYRVAGKIDGIVEQVDGARWVLEHKTSSDDISPGAPYWQRLRLDAQISIYLDGARTLGYEPAGCIYDVIARPQQKPKMATPVESRKYNKKDGALYANQRATDETPEEFGERVAADISEDPTAYYQRGEVVRTADEMTDARREIWNSAKLLRFAQREGCQPRNPAACAPFRGSVCAYFDLCSGAAVVDGERYRVRESAHPELAAQPIPKEGNQAA